MTSSAVQSSNTVLIHISFSDAQYSKRGRGNWEKQMNEVIKAVTGLWNTNGGTIMLVFEPVSFLGKLMITKIDEFMKSLEHRLFEFIPRGFYRSHIHRALLKSGQYLLYVDGHLSHNYFLTVRSNLFLRTQTSVVDCSFSSVQLVQEILERKAFTGKSTLFGSHAKHFVQGFKAGVRESKTVKLEYTEYPRTYSPAALLGYTEYPRTHRAAARKLSERIDSASGSFARIVSGFANFEGGHIYYGIDNHGIVQGEIIIGDMIAIITKVRNAVNKMIWPRDCGQSNITRGKQWEIFFERVKDNEGKIIPSTFVVVIYIAKCPGGVFTEVPESYHIVNGKIAKLGFDHWKRRILHPDWKMRILHPDWKKSLIQAITDKEKRSDYTKFKYAEIDKEEQSDSEESIDGEKCKEDQSDSEESIDGELTWFEETFLNDAFQLKDKYKDILISLPWIEGFYIGPASAASAAANSLQLFIICKQKETPSLIELQKGFGDDIIYFINFIPGTEFQYLENDNISDNATPEPPLVSAEHSIYHCEDSDQEHGSLGILVADSEGRLFATTCYHVCYHGKKKCKEDLARWFNQVTADSINKNSPTRTSKYCYKCGNDQANGDDKTMLGKFFWGEHNEEHDIALVRLTRELECSCTIRNVSSKFASQKTISKKLRKSPTGVAVRKTGFSTGTTEGILIGFDGYTLPGRKRAALKNIYLVKDKDDTHPFSSPGDSGSALKIVRRNKKETLFGYVVLRDANKLTYCFSLHDSLVRCEHLQETLEKNGVIYLEPATRQEMGGQIQKPDEKKYFLLPVFFILLAMLVSIAFGMIGSAPPASKDASGRQ